MIGAHMEFEFPKDHYGIEVPFDTRELAILGSDGTFAVEEFIYSPGILGHDGTWIVVLEDDYGTIVGEFKVSDCRLAGAGDKPCRCPFCGGESHVVDGEDGCCVECGDCGARSGTHMHGCAKDAIRSWDGVSRMVLGE